MLQDRARPVLTVGVVVPKLPARGANVTGSPAHVLKTCAALERRGTKVSLIELDLDGAHRPLHLLRLLARAGQELRAHPDVLHCHGHISAGAVLPLATLLGIPMLVEVHGLHAPSRGGVPGTRPLLSRAMHMTEIPLLRRAGHVVVQALAMRDRLVEEGVPRVRITVIYPGLRTAEFSGYHGPRVAVPGAVAGEKLVVYIGSTLPFQGLDLLAGAQRLLPPGFRVALVLSGEAGPRGGVVRCFGFDPERTFAVYPSGSGAIPAWCRTADVLVHARPDVPDNVNVQSKLGLYLAAGRPVVATDVGDYPVLMGDSPGCVLTRPEPHALAAGIQAAVLPEVAIAAAERNPRIACRYFEADVNVERLVGLYQALLEGRPRARLGVARGAAPRRRGESWPARR